MYKFSESKGGEC